MNFQTHTSYLNGQHGAHRGLESLRYIASHLLGIQKVQKNK